MVGKLSQQTACTSGMPIQTIPSSVTPRTA